MLLVAVLLGPPSILMGGTIAILTQALFHDLEDVTRFHALVYACNTLEECAAGLEAAYPLRDWGPAPQRDPIPSSFRPWRRASRVFRASVASCQH